MDDDPYGFAFELDRDSAKVLDKTGVAAFLKQVRARFDAAAKQAPGEAFRRDPDDQRRLWGAALRTHDLARKNIEAYVTLAGSSRRAEKPPHSVSL